MGPLRPLHAAHVAELARELAALCGRALRDVAPRPPRDVVLVFEPEPEPEPRGAARVLLSADADWPRAHLARAREAPYAGPPGPFAVAARQELAGLALESVEDLRGDRLLALCFRPAPGMPGGGGPRTLIAELVPRHPNLVLLDGGGRVAALLVEAEDPSRARLALGRAYEPPPAPRHAPPPAPPLHQVLAPLADPSAPFPLSLAVEQAFGAALEARARVRAASALESELAAKRQGVERQLAGLAAREEAARLAPGLREQAELLKAHLAAVPRGVSSVDVPDYFAAAEGAQGSEGREGALRRVELDPKLSPRANLERLYAKAEKLERSTEGLERERALLAARAAEIGRAEQRLAELAGRPGALPEIEALAGEARASGLLEPPQAPPERRATPAPRVPYRSFRGSAGSEIRVGRSARDNDELTFKHCRGNDVWLHTADAPGSHVVLRMSSAAEPDEQELLDAAHLAVHFSPLAGARRAGVTVCRAKDVRKPRGAKPGLVSVGGARRLDLRVEPERLARLLGRDAHA